MTRIAAILCVRNEGAFLLEWLAHHRAAGISDFIVFSNDCQDGTDAMLDRLEKMGHLVHHRNDAPHDKAGIQFTALRRAAKLPELRAADWILHLDVDEFVNVHVGDRTLPALLDALPEATAITLTWRLFGNAGIVAYEDRPVTQIFTRAAPAILHWPWRAAMFKTLYRNDGTFARPGVHRPRGADPARLAGARWFDGSGREMPGAAVARRGFSAYGQDNYALVQLNHYALGAMESYVIKADRGRINHAGEPMAMDYWTERNFDAEEDRSILALAPRMQAGLDALHADPVLAGLHDRAVAWRHARYAALMAEDGPRALMGRLMMTPPSRALSRNAAAALLAHARRAPRP